MRRDPFRFVLECHQLNVFVIEALRSLWKSSGEYPSRKSSRKLPSDLVESTGCNRSKLMTMFIRKFELLRQSRSPRLSRHDRVRIPTITSYIVIRLLLSAEYKSIKSNACLVSFDGCTQYRVPKKSRSRSSRFLKTSLLEPTYLVCWDNVFVRTLLDENVPPSWTS